MSDILIRGLDKPTFERLRARARRHGRSLGDGTHPPGDRAQLGDHVLAVLRRLFPWRALLDVHRSRDPAGRRHG